MGLRRAWPFCGRAVRSMRKCRIEPQIPGQDFPMDAEHINIIGNQLADLSNRVNELRGYL